MEKRRLEGGQSKKNLRTGIVEGILATPWVLLSVPGGFIFAALLTQHYGIGPGLFGLIVSMPAWASALQVLLLPGLAGFFSARDVALSLSWLNLGLWVMLIVILPFLPVDQPGEVGMVFVFFFVVASASASLIGVGWTAWVRSWVPERVRGIYFGKRNRLIQAATVTFFLIATVLLSGLMEGVRPFQLLIGIAVGLRFFSILWQHRIVDSGPTALTQAGQSWWGGIRGLLRVRDFRLFVLFMMWCSFWIGAAGPFSVLFILEYLELTPSQFAILSIVATVSGALMTPFWGRMIDRSGCRTCIFWALLVWWSTGYLPAFLGPSTAWILFIGWFIGGAAAGGFFLGVFNLLFKVIPGNVTTAGISLNTALTSLTAAIGPLLLGGLIARSEWFGVAEEWMYRGMFLFVSTMMLLGLLLLVRIREPRRRESGFTFVGAMRSLRLGILAHGYAFVANTNSIFKTTRRPRPLSGADAERGNHDDSP